MRTIIEDTANVLVRDGHVLPAMKLRQRFQRLQEEEGHRGMHAIYFQDLQLAQRGERFQVLVPYTFATAQIQIAEISHVTSDIDNEIVIHPYAIGDAQTVQLPIQFRYGLLSQPVDQHLGYIIFGFYKRAMVKFHQRQSPEKIGIGVDKGAQNSVVPEIGAIYYLEMLQPLHVRQSDGSEPRLQVRAISQYQSF